MRNTGLQTSGSMATYCGYAGHNVGPTVWVAGTLVHSPPAVPIEPGAETGSFTRFRAQAYRFLCTTYPQVFAHNQSVATWFVHIFHRAYKYQSKVNKEV